MKFNFDIKNKKAGIEADVEKIVEKGMDLHEKDWKDKFSTKHNAKKEIMELKHKQKMETEKTTQGKMNFIQKIQEEKRKRLEIELEEKRKQLEIEIEEKHRQEKKNKKVIKQKIIFSIILGIIGSAMIIIGYILGSNSGDPDSGLYAIAGVGMFILMPIAFIWINNSEKDESKSKRKSR